MLFRSHKKKRRERREESDDEEGGPPEGIGELDESDYFLKSTELKVWLDEEKGKVRCRCCCCCCLLLAEGRS